MTKIELQINGKLVCFEGESRTHLGDFLRETMNLTGTHLGCEHGAPARSCIQFAASCAGYEIRTIEDFGDDEVMTQLRDAFSKEHALQCGFCTPGMLITARDIVLRLPELTSPEDEARIRNELSGNLCRCTGYQGIVQAIQSVLRLRAMKVKNDH